MTLNSISLNFQRISRDFADFGRTNSYTNKDRPVFVSDNVVHDVSTSNWSNFSMLLRRVGSSATAGLSCSYWLAGLLSFKRALLSVDVSV